MKKTTIAFIIASICMQPTHTHAKFSDHVTQKNIFIALTLLNAIGFVTCSGVGIHHAKKLKDLKEDLEQENLCPEIREILEKLVEEKKTYTGIWTTAAIIELLFTIGCAFGMRSSPHASYKMLVEDGDEIEL